MLLLCMSCLTCPLLCHTGALVQHRRKQWSFRCCSSSTRIRTCPSCCNDRRWSRRADNCGVAAVAVLRVVRGDSKVQFMDTVVFMRTARGDLTGAVLGEVAFWALYTGTGPGAPVMRTGAGWRRRPGVVSRGVLHPLIIACVRRHGETLRRYSTVRTTTTANHPQERFPSQCDRLPVLPLEDLLRSSWKATTASTAPPSGFSVKKALKRQNEERRRKELE